jgi:protocatechuate 3,4-dioxygenase alpha subunit
MSLESSRIPAGSQTVGPYFRIGLEYLLDRTPSIPPDTSGMIQLRGRVLDRDGAPVPDAMLEFWSATTAPSGPDKHLESRSFPIGFRRAPTDADGVYSVVIERPSMKPHENENAHASHMLVMVFARGLLRHLISRVYFEDDPANQGDPVLMMVPEERRTTLIAQSDPSAVGAYRWDITLQGPGETVFFAW